ncbi:MAG: septum site-determining protein MinC [Syntrophomonas sp.]|nr:septum site-determining protein MinC [Syntrophomonas sp.]
MIKIKGMNGNLVFIFGQGGFEDYLSFLEEKLSANKQLFSGSRAVFKGEGLKKLSHFQIASLQELCLRFGMIMNNSEVTVNKGASKDMVIYRNLRSGQKLRSEGSVIIWGDVHESAEILAAGDIIVLGKLDGIAHAGCYGDMSRLIFALSLSPGQIRIGDRLSRSPEDADKSPHPEIAFWDGENICIKAYSSRSGLRG